MKKIIKTLLLLTVTATLAGCNKKEGEKLSPMMDVSYSTISYRCQGLYDNVYHACSSLTEKLGPKKITSTHYEEESFTRRGIEVQKATAEDTYVVDFENAVVYMRSTFNEYNYGYLSNQYVNENIAFYDEEYGLVTVKDLDKAPYWYVFKDADFIKEYCTANSMTLDEFLWNYIEAEMITFDNVYCSDVFFTLASLDRQENITCLNDYYSDEAPIKEEYKINEKQLSVSLAQKLENVGDNTEFSTLGTFEYTFDLAFNALDDITYDHESVMSGDFYPDDTMIGEPGCKIVTIERDRVTGEANYEIPDFRGMPKKELL